MEACGGNQSAIWNKGNRNEEGTVVSAPSWLWFWMVVLCLECCGMKGLQFNLVVGAGGGMHREGFQQEVMTRN